MRFCFQTGSKSTFYFFKIQNSVRHELRSVVDRMILKILRACQFQAAFHIIQRYDTLNLI